jgi:hypothetical protein
VLARPVDTTPPASHPTAEVRLDLQPTTTAHIEEAARAEVLTLELQLAVAFELLHHFNMVKKSRSLSTEELDLVEFLVTQVASLSSSLAVEAVIVVSLSWRWVRRGVLLCVPIGVLSWQQSIVEGSSSFWFLIIASPARWSRGDAWLTLGRVPCAPIFISLLLFLPVTPACQADSSDLLGRRMWRLFVVRWIP